MKKRIDYVTKIDLNEALERYDKNLQKYKDEILTGLDKVMGELQTMREENTIRYSPNARS